MSKKYTCKKCNFHTDNLYNLNAHKKTKKHINIHAFLRKSKIDREQSKIDREKSNNDINKSLNKCICEYCNKSISHKNNVKRHHKACKKYIEHMAKQEKDLIIKQLNDALNQHKNQLKERDDTLKKKDKKLKKKQEELDDLKNIEKEFLEFMKTMAKNKSIGNTTNNIKNVNMFFIIQRYIDAKNCEDLMDPPLTKDEEQYVLDNGGVYGGYHILYKRCIEGLNMEDRPFHCVDNARNKYMIRTKNTWQIDKKGKMILDSIYPRMLQLCAPKQITSLDEMDTHKKHHNYMVDLTTSGKGKILKMLNEKTLLKNNVDTK